MKFRCLVEKQQFAIDINRFDLVEDTDFLESTNLDQDLLNEFIKKRKPLISQHKDFRKKQDAKRNWRTSRWATMLGIKKFHKSTKGKRFHRSLGRFLATRMFRGKSLSMMSALQAEALKAVSSVKTHLHIDSEYYRPLTEQIEFDLFYAEAVPVLHTLEESLYRGTFDEIDDDTMELLVAITERKEIVNAIKNSFGDSFSTKLEELNKRYPEEEPQN